MSTRQAITRARSALLQGQAAVLVLVFVTGQIGSYVHAAFERHARCPEHGELIHVGDHADGQVDGRSVATAPARPGETSSLLDASAGDEQHAHEHCYMCPVSRERLAPGQSNTVIAVATPAAVQHALPAVTAHVARAGYVIAPKTSPPA